MLGDKERGERDEYSCHPFLKKKIERKRKEKERKRKKEKERKEKRERERDRVTERGRREEKPPLLLPCSATRCRCWSCFASVSVSNAKSRRDFIFDP